MKASSDPTVAGGEIAARQATAIIALVALPALVAIPDLQEPWLLATIPISGIAIAVLILAFPWTKWRPEATAWLCLPCFALLGAATWIFDGFAAGTGPFYVLVFAWMGLHHAPVVIALSTLPAVISYVVALGAAQASAHVIGSTFVLMPVAVAVALAISQRVRALAAAQETIHAEERWRAAMMSTLAHDIRSPLTSVGGAIELLTDSPDVPVRLRPLLESAMRQTRRITRLATGLLEVDRVEQGQLRLDRTEVGMRDLALEVAAITSPDDVVVDVDAALHVWADRERLEQILVNLTNNALRHGRAPVVISASNSDDHSSISVRDHGGGVPEEDVAHLFSKFSSSDKAPHSVGLGL